MGGAAFLPGDGQANPSDTTQALARGARSAGVQIVENCLVTGILVEQERVIGVETNHGTIICEKVVNCAGQWARELGDLAGVNVPLVSVQHQYVVTENLDGVTSSLPTLRDPDRLVYFKEEVGGLVMGGYEQNPLSWAQDGIPSGFNGRLLTPDWEHFEQLFEQAIEWVPALAQVGVRSLVNGPESFTPDGNFILGEAPEVANFFVGAGFNAFGIAAAGGAGKALAEWVMAGEQPVDLWSVDIKRFGSVHRDVEWVRSRSLELYAKHYAITWPNEEHESARPRLRSALYQDLLANGACFGSKLGWERPNWFASDGDVPKDRYSFARPGWFTAVGREHQACRQRVALFDQSSFAKFLVEGPEAEACLQWVCANDVSKAPGSITYTQMLNDRGGIECDLTVTRLSDESFYLVTGTGFRTHDLSWISRSIQNQSGVKVTDVTEEVAVLSLMGPNARHVLEQLTEDDVSGCALPFASVREIRLAGVLVRALRVTYVGELGWELHVKREQVLALYRALMKAGRKFGIVDAGYRAIESLRLEKGYRAWGSELGPDHTPIEAGLSWATKLKTDMPFRGRDSLETQLENGVRSRLGCFTLDRQDVNLVGNETIYRDGQRVGWLASAGWGYAANTNIGFGYVRGELGIDAAYLAAGEYELEVATHRIACASQPRPLYDPNMIRVKA